MMAARSEPPASPIEVPYPVRRKLTGLALCLTLPLVGCERAWDLANRHAAVADVRAVLAIGAIPTDTLECHMIGATRGVECRLGADPPAISRIVTALGLVPVDPSAPAGLAELVRREAPADLAARPLATFAIAGRPATLRLPNGTAFQHLLLFHDSAAGTARLRLAYAYG